MIRARAAGAALVAGVLLTAGMATATSVQKFSIKDLSTKSNAIVRATVESAVSEQDATSREIYTYVTLRVVEPVKGATKDQILTIRQLGGEVGTLASIVPGMPSFKATEEVVVFLTEKDHSGHSWVMGLQQGKYSIRTDAKGMKFVRNDLEDLKLVEPDGSVREAPRGRHELSLESFLGRVRTELNEAGRIEVSPSEPE